MNERVELPGEIIFDERGNREIRSLVLFAADQDRHTGLIDLDAEGDADWLDSLDILELDAVRLEAQRMIRAARAVLTRVEVSLLADVIELGSVRLGKEGFYAGKETDRHLTDPDGLLEWLYRTGGIAAVKAAVPVNDEVRIGAIRGIAGDNGQDAKAVEDTFFHTTYGNVVLKKTKPGTKWVEGLRHGERRP